VGGNSVRKRSAWRRILLGVGISMLWLSLLPTGGAVASPPPPAPVTVATYEGSIGEPAVAIDEAGEATVAWVADGHLRVATRPTATARWHVSGRSFPAATRPQLTMDSGGDAVLVWEQWEGSALILMTAFRPAGGGWGAATPLSGDIREGQGRWHLAMNAEGDAAIVWNQYRHQEFPPLDAYYVLATTMSGGSGTWSPPTEISAPSGGLSPDLAVNGRGEAIVAWRAYDEATRTVTVQATFGPTNPAGAPWSVPVTLSRAGEYITEEGPRVAIGDDGGALVTWGNAGRLCPGALPSTLVAASVSPGGSWSVPATISRWGECPVEVQPAIGAGGRATALWESFGLRATDLRAASGRLTGNEWTRPRHLATASRLPGQSTKCRDLCPRPPAGLARLVVTGDGGFFAAWRQEGVGIVGSLQGKDHWPRPTTLLSAPGSVELALRALAVAYRPQGEVLLVWVRGRDIQVDAVRIPSPAATG
jgi:hypothetical protein